MVSYSLPTQEETPLLHQAIAVDVIYVDENVIVVNKPAGMVVHPGAGNTQDTLVNAILHRWPEMPTWVSQRDLELCIAGQRNLRSADSGAQRSGLQLAGAPIQIAQDQKNLPGFGGWRTAFSHRKS